VCPLLENIGGVLLSMGQRRPIVVPLEFVLVLITSPGGGGGEGGGGGGSLFSANKNLSAAIADGVAIRRWAKRLRMFMFSEDSSLVGRKIDHPHLLE